MSGFLSSKYLKYQSEIYRRPIEEDLACVRCGYNVRGLVYGQACPECGTSIEPEGEDVLLAGGPPAQRRWRIGLAILFLCVVGAVAARLLLFIAGAAGLGRATAMAYLACGLVLSCLWFVAAWLVTPPILGVRFMFMGTLRWVVRGSQLLWPLGYAIWLAGYAEMSTTWITWGRGMRFFAAVGTILLITMLIAVAYSAQRENAARRLRAAAWLLPVVTLLPYAFPSSMAWFFLVPLGLTLLFWAWVMLVFAAALGELHRHVRWTMKDATRLASRDARVAEIRREHDQVLEASVRPVPPPAPEIPFEDDPER